MIDRIAVAPAAKAALGVSQGLAHRTAFPQSAWRRRVLALLLVVLIAVPASALAAPLTDSYVVQAGDTLADIAARMGVSVWTLAEENGIQNFNLIYPGQVLATSGGSASAATSTAATAATAPTAVAPTAGAVHVVEWGDTLSKIAARYGTTVSALMSANGLSSANLVWVGQQLTVNAVSGGAASGSSASYTASSPASTGQRWIDLDLTNQRLTAYEGDVAVFSELVSTGIDGWNTPPGEFEILYKVDSQTMSGPGYYLTNVQWVMFFYGADAIHGTYWHDNFGQPMSHGCVNLPNEAAAWLYAWSDVGTPVWSHY